jgi:transposase
MKICIGVDLHKTQFTVYARSETGMFGKYLTTSEGYGQFLGQLETWRSEGHTIRLGVESTGNTRYFKSRMEQAGHKVVVINTLKFKVVNESVKKTDKHDAATIAEFLEKDMLPESRLCSETSEQLRRYLSVRKTLVRTIVSVKNQIHALLVSLGMEDCKASEGARKSWQPSKKRLSDSKSTRCLKR